MPKALMDQSLVNLQLSFEKLCEILELFFVITGEGVQRSTRGF